MPDTRIHQPTSTPTALAPESRIDFYQRHLDKVSRSFAFCIARLESPLREVVSLGYLLCRLIDTVEDAPWENEEAQTQAFRAFDRFFAELSSVDACREWANRFPDDIPSSERDLLNDSHAIFSEYHSLSDFERSALRAPIRSMSAGMQHYQSRRWREGELRLRDAADVNEYCFFVAGVVGEMLARLVHQEAYLIEAFRFGLFLQKVNLLKDEESDAVSGRYLVTNAAEIQSSAAVDAREGLKFLLALPIKEEGFRLFCAWSLFLGLASFKWIAKGEKIPRSETMALLIGVEEKIADNSKLAELFESLVIVPPVAKSTCAGDSSQVLDLYFGELDSRKIAEILR